MSETGADVISLVLPLKVCDILFILVTNPIDVIKIRLQLDNELSNQKNIFKDRKYKGFLGGGLLIAREEGMRGLYKGFVHLSFIII